MNRIVGSWKTKVIDEHLCSSFWLERRSCDHKKKHVDQPTIHLHNPPPLPITLLTETTGTSTTTAWATFPLPPPPLLWMCMRGTITRPAEVVIRALGGGWTWKTNEVKKRKKKKPKINSGCKNRIPRHPHLIFLWSWLATWLYPQDSIQVLTAIRTRGPGSRLSLSGTEGERTRGDSNSRSFESSFGRDEFGVMERCGVDARLCDDVMVSLVRLGIVGCCGGEKPHDGWKAVTVRGRATCGGNKKGQFKLLW